jgi:hypothetical protein
MAGQIVLTAASSGTVTLTPADTGNAFVATIPAVTGNLVSTGSTGVVTGAMLASSAALTNLYGLTYLPLFSGYRNAGLVSATNVVLHNVINVNTGSHYSAATGRFTCPVAGNYEVSVGGHAENTQPATTYIYKNGSAVQGEYTSGSAYGAASCTIVITCAANDFIQHFVTAGTMWGGDPSGLRMTVKLISV